MRTLDCTETGGLQHGRCSRHTGGVTCLDKLGSPQVEHELRIVGHVFSQREALGLLFLVLPKPAGMQPQI